MSDIDAGHYEYEDEEEDGYYDDYEYSDYEDDVDPEDYEYFSEPLPLTPFMRFVLWSRRFRYTVRLTLSDPLARFRRCDYCGKRGCVPGEKQCGEHWIPF